MDIGEPKRVIEITEPAVPYRGDPVPEERPKPKRAPEKEPAKTRMRQIGHDLLQKGGGSPRGVAKAICDRLVRTQL